MMRTAIIQSAIRSELIQRGPCPLQTLLNRLPEFSWSEVFAAIDQLSREGNLVLRHPNRFDYELSVGPIRPTSEQPADGSDAEGETVFDRAEVGSQVYEERTPA